MDRTEKKGLIDELNGVFQKTSVVVVAHYSGLTVAQLQRLRKQMREAGATVQVTKNRLTKIALEGTDVASIGSLLTGPTILAYSDDPVAAPTLAVLAQTAGLSRYQFLRGFARATGLTPHAYLMQRRLHRARQLIARGARLAEAAAVSGFADQSHMTRLFVRSFGMGPGTYAKAVG